MLRRRIVNSHFFTIFNTKDDLARGRVSMLLSSIIVTINSFLTSGFFLTGFLIANDIDIVNAGIISFIPFVANSFSIFSPIILERFEKRRLILSLGRSLNYFFGILGVTVLPLFVHDKGIKVVIFAVLMFLAGVSNALTVSGYAAWQINFIPNKVRADYISYNQTYSFAVTAGVIVLSSVIADKLEGSAYENKVLYAIRFFGLFLAILDVIILSSPKEYPYTRSTKTKLKNVFTLPFKNKPFIYTMVIVFAWTFVQNLTYSLLDYYLLNDVGVKYTFISFINAFYAIFLFTCSRYWKKVLNKYSWFRTFAFSAILLAPTTFLYAFVTADTYLVIMTIVRFTQHFVGVGLNLTFANMVYVNLPQEDRTNYTSFHQFGANISAFIGIMAGTSFVALTENYILNVWGYSFTSVQMLILIQAILQLVVAYLVLKLLPLVSNYEE